MTQCAIQGTDMRSQKGRPKTTWLNTIITYMVFNGKDYCEQQRAQMDGEQQSVELLTP